VAEDGTLFEAVIESFTLAVPKMLNWVNWNIK
jgi:uncharacterized protein affecting Mg2+/Co2+ transport